MTDPMKRFKARAMARPGVAQAYEALADEFAFLDEVLKARVAAGLTQAEVAKRIGTTQSAIARLESVEAKHSPTLATLRRYADALGYSVQIRLIKNQSEVQRMAGQVDVKSMRGAFPGMSTKIRRERRDRV